MQVVGRRYDSGQAIALDIAGGQVVAVRPLSDRPDQPRPWIAPGFVDLQVNGFGGRDFQDAALTVDDVTQVGLALDACGVTNYYPTVITNRFESQRAAVSTIARARREVPEVALRVPGIHLEGPYISPEDGPRGAHPPQFVRPPDWDEFCRLQDAAEGLIRIVTLSPEYDVATAFIRRAAAAGVIVAIGHTNADADQIRAAVDAGARLSTHLGNGSHALIRRHHNYIWDQLSEDRLVASLILDGHHLPPAVIRALVRAKSPDRCVLISDVTVFAGMPPGRYDQADRGVVDVLEEGRVVVAGQRELLAGAALPIGVGVSNAMRYADVDLRTAVEMASVRPAALLGLTAGGLDVGSRADLVLFDLPHSAGTAPGPDALVVRSTINAGRLVFDRCSR
jgi:N-acetylglucosamine-6-phosphate deacetylase